MNVILKNSNWVPLLVIASLMTYDGIFFFIDQDGRKGSMDYISDIRIIHQYCNYAIGFISLILGLMIGRLEDVKKHIGSVDILPFLIALGAAGFCIMFIPVSYVDEFKKYVHLYWLIKVMLEQIVVVATIHGLITISLKVYNAAKV
jgi:hypothetical protein